MFAPHLLTSEIQFGACDELDARAVTASERRVCSARREGGGKQYAEFKWDNLTFIFRLLKEKLQRCYVPGNVKYRNNSLKYQRYICATLYWREERKGKNIK